ncbi:MAG: HEAT repeat domain-containing protein [Planctomycetes bacterium]|nr:HEAT repeat domain-containing protein [Planctomycetota bacterium]
MTRIVGSVLLALLVSALVLPGTAQEPEPEPKAEPKAEPKTDVPPPPTPEIVNALNQAFRDKHEPSAVAALEQAVQAIKEDARAVREKAELLKVMQVGLGNPNDRVKLVTVNALGRVGPEAAKPLSRALHLKPYEKNRELTQAVIEALGLTRDEKTALEDLVKIITAHPDWSVRALAARALSNFDKNHASGQNRKKICEKMIQIYESIESAAADGRDSEAVRKRNAIREDFVSTLRALTEEEWNSGSDWRKWYNKAKRERWPDPPKKKEPGRS